MHGTAFRVSGGCRPNPQTPISQLHRLIDAVGDAKEIDQGGKHGPDWRERREIPILQR